MKNSRVIALLLGLTTLAAGQTPPAKPSATTTSGPMLSFTATTDNVAGAPDPIRIDLLRWSTDTERDQLLAAWNLKGAAAPGAAGGRGPAGRGGRGRGAAVSDDADPATEAPAPTVGGRGRGGRGSGEDALPPAQTPEGALATALKQGTTVGYLWSSEVAGYALRYAGQVAGPNGVDRIILITDRRLGKTNDLWTPTGPGAGTTHDFSVIELRVNSKGEGEGKISLIGRVTLDGAARIVAPENYGALPVVLRNLKRRAVDGH